MRVYAGLCGLARFDSETGTAGRGRLPTFATKGYGGASEDDDDDEDGERVLGGAQGMFYP